MAVGLLDHADALGEVSRGQDAAVARDVNAIFAKHGGSSAVTHDLHQMLPQVLDLHAHIAGQLTASWYDQIDPSSDFHAEPFVDIPPEQVTKVVDWALHAPGDEPPQSRLTGASQRIVRNTSRLTVVRNAAKEGVRYARVAKADACSFCRALAIRGSGREDRKWLYDTEDSAIFRKSDGEKYHTHCECQPVPVRGGQIWVPPAYAAEWEAQFDAAAKATPKGPKYFQRIAAQMRTDEPKETPEAEGDEGRDADVIQMPSPQKVAAREALDTATTFDEIREAAQKVLPDTNVDIGHEALFMQSDAGSPHLWQDKSPLVVDNIKDMVRAVDDIMTKYPELELETLHDTTDFTGGHHTDPYATASSHYQDDRWTNSVNVNRKWLTNVGALEDSWKMGLETGFHFPGTDRPIYNIVVHEMGHVVQRNAENNGVNIGQADINRALATHWATEVFDPADDPAADSRPRISRRDAYYEWLRDNLSGYSTHAVAVLPGRRNGPDISSTVNGREALAEAFADVEINGDEASETSIVLHALLVDAFTRSLEGGSHGDLAPAI